MVWGSRLSLTLLVRSESKDAIRLLTVAVGLRHSLIVRSTSARRRCRSETGLLYQAMIAVITPTTAINCFHHFLSVSRFRFSVARIPARSSGGDMCFASPSVDAGGVNLVV